MDRTTYIVKDGIRLKILSSEFENWISMGWLDWNTQRELNKQESINKIEELKSKLSKE